MTERRSPGQVMADLRRTQVESPLGRNMLDVTFNGGAVLEAEGAPIVAVQDHGDHCTLVADVVNHVDDHMELVSGKRRVELDLFGPVEIRCAESDGDGDDPVVGVGSEQVVKAALSAVVGARVVELVVAEERRIDLRLTGGRRITALSGSDDLDWQLTCGGFRLSADDGGLDLWCEDSVVASG